MRFMDLFMQWRVSGGTGRSAGGGRAAEVRVAGKRAAAAGSGGPDSSMRLQMKARSAHTHKHSTIRTPHRTSHACSHTRHHAPPRAHPRARAHTSTRARACDFDKQQTDDEKSRSRRGRTWRRWSGRLTCHGTGMGHVSMWTRGEGGVGLSRRHAPGALEGAWKARPTQGSGGAKAQALHPPTSLLGSPPTENPASRRCGGWHLSSKMK